MNSQDFTPWPETFSRKYRDKAYWQGENLFSILQRSADCWPDKCAIVCETRQWTYLELKNKALQLAAGFQQLGLKKGDKVILQLPNCGEYVEIIFAFFASGIVPIMALPAHRTFELEYFATHADVKAIVTSSAKLATSSAAQDDRVINTYHGLAKTVCQSISRNTCEEKQAKQSPHLIVVNTADDTPLKESFIDIESLYQTATELQKLIEVVEAKDTLALMQLSGGTTNVPKLIPRTHDDYLYSVRESAKICGLDESSVYLCALPIAHNFPMSSPGVLGVLLAGGKLVMSSSPAADCVLPLIKKHEVTITSAVPPLALAWMQSVENHVLHDHVKSLQVLQVGGAKFSAEVAKKVRPILGCQLQQVFGMAEGLVNYTRLDDKDDIVVYTQGRPISEDDEIRIVDDNDREVSIGTEGHLLTRGPYTIRGYFKAEQHNRSAFTSDGFYRTGDIARLTESGYLVVEGRAKDQINRGGEKISAEELENQLLAHADVKDVAVIAVEDAYLGEKTCACIILASGESPLSRLKHLRQYLREQGLAEYKMPDIVRVMQEFPKTSFGKVSKKALREMINQMFAKAHKHTPANA